MNQHPLIGRVEDQVIRKILEDYQTGINTAVAQAIAGMTFTITGSSGGSIEEGNEVRIRPIIENQASWPRLNDPRAGG